MENLTLRKATDTDSEFAYQVKKLAFGAYIEQVWGWNEAEQRRLHEKRFASQDFSVITLSGVEVGILATVREHSCLKINQLFILPEYQNKNIGRACMMRIIYDMAASKTRIRLQVLKVNKRAVHFFESLGFDRVDETDTHVRMELAH